MAGPREQSADTSLDDILSSIRKIVTDDLDGAEKLREKLADAQAAAASLSAPRTPSLIPPQTPAAPVLQANVSEPQVLADQDSTAALIAAARAAAGTPARDFVASEPQPSQAAIASPRESLAPFDRATSASNTLQQVPNLGAGLGAPIVLPTEAEANGHLAQSQTPIPVEQIASEAPVAPSVSNGSVVLDEATAVDPISAVDAHGLTSPDTLNPVDAGEPIDLRNNVADANGHVADLVVPQPCANMDATGGNGHMNSHMNGFNNVNGLANDEPTLNGHNVATQAPVNGHAVHATAPPAPVAQTPAAEMPHVAPSIVVEEGAGHQTHAGAQVAGMSSTMLEQAVSRMLRPMLKDWLDQNMPRLIEQALRAEAPGPSQDRSA